MSKDSVAIPIRAVHETTKANSVSNACNVIVVSLDHSKTRKAAVISAYPAEDQPNGIRSILVTSQESHVVEPMQRLSAKRIEALRSAMRNELSAKTGAAWALVELICKKKGYEPV